MQKNNKREKPKIAESLDNVREREREREREPKFINKEKSKILKLNLSATMVVAVAIVFIIIAIIAVRMIVTAINSNSQKALAEEETQGYTMVDSTELGEDGKPLQVPVPDGFTASQVPGETTVNGGFVIYEGEVDWSKIEDLDSYAEVETQAQAEEAYASTENADLDSSNRENSEEVSTESNNADATSNSDSSTTNESNIEEVAEEEQIQDANLEQADLPENLQEEIQENVTSEENEMTQEQIDAENVQVQEEEMIDTEQTDKNTEENGEELEQANNEIIKEEESISNEEAGIATMSKEGKDADTGIATLAEGESPTTVFDLQKSRNQYVWVPVKDVSRIYGVDSNGKLWGKLYNYSQTATERIPYWSESNGVMSSQKNASYREPDVTHYRTNYDVDGILQSYKDGIEQYQMISQEMEENFYKMIESVKKYGGFYIGRYETGNLNQEEAVVQKMNNNLGGTGITWYVIYEKCKNLAGTKENVETSMIWGSLWDETLQWLIDSEAEITTGEKMTYGLIARNSTNWGNYKSATFEYINANGVTTTKNIDSSAKIPTGSTEYTKANNIYDMAGNVYEWTLEALSTTYRGLRGGRYGLTGIGAPADHRHGGSPTGFNSYYGCRAALYIK